MFKAVGSSRWVQVGGFSAVAAGPPVLSGSCRIMMRDLPRPVARVLVAATFLGSIGFVGMAPMVSWAQGAVPESSSAAAPAPDIGTQPSTPPGTPPGVSTPENGARPPAPDPD